MKKLVLSVLLLSSFLQQLYSESLVNLDTINNRVIKLFKQENYSDCYNLAKDLYSLSKDANDTILVFNSLYYMGFSNQRMGNMEKAIDYNMRAYEVSQSLHRLDLQSSILNNIGNVYMVNDEDSVAAVYFEKSIEIEKNLGESRRSQLAVRLGNVSTAYMKLGRCEDAVSAAEEGLRIDKEVGRPNKIAIRLNQLGDVYMACGRQQEAIQCEREAYSYFEKAGSKYGMSIVLHSLGEMYEQDSNIDSALFYFHKSLECAEIIDNKLLIQEISKSLYNIYKDTNPRLAVDYYEQYVNIKDSIFNEKNQKMLNDFRIKYSTREKDLEIELYKRDNQYHENVLRLTMLLIFLLIITIILLVRNGISRKRRNAVLLELNNIKNRSISVLSHDLKNPVIAQKMVLNHLYENYDEISDDDMKMYIAALTDSVNSLEELLVNMLEWTKFEMKRMEYKPINFDIRDICFNEVVPLFNTIAQKKQITIRECDVKLDSYIVYSDLRMISAVLRNLISNALKFSSDGKEVVICFVDLDDKIKVVVKDCGVGIPEDKVKLLLSGKSFTTLGTKGEQGSGIGMDLINKMLHQCNSELNIMSVLGEGSEFSFVLKKINDDKRNCC
ncbi:MAG: tetratricopeptide repeat-containing sensor histidine kinase [Bacteroidales bacterium]|nr:tetratricopeptide repeat-containing sensor histidine kinase [Bacteroidales bacterium]